MNLYEVSCGMYTFYAVSKSESEAVKKVQERENLQHLPFKAVEIDLEGYTLVKKR